MKNMTSSEEAWLQISLEDGVPLQGAFTNSCPVYFRCFLSIQNRFSWDRIVRVPDGVRVVFPSDTRLVPGSLCTPLQCPLPQVIFLPLPRKFSTWMFITSFHLAIPRSFLQIFAEMLLAAQKRWCSHVIYTMNGNDSLQWCLGGPSWPSGIDTLWYSCASWKLS